MILCRIQGHPSRAELHGPLAKALSPLSVELRIHASDPPDPWQGYKSCLSDLPDCSHVLILQDDAQPVENFVPALELIAERQPLTPVCLFMGALPASTAVLARRRYDKGTRYIPLMGGNFVPAVGILWPRSKAEDFLFWSKTARTTRADDGNIARWMRQAKQPFLVALPSIVQHDDSQRSVKGGREHIPWKESWRRALFLADDALNYDW